MSRSRSNMMSRVRGAHTAPEKRLRHLLWSRGLRYRLHTKTPFGRPDLVFLRQQVAVFVDGCFWHGCPVHYVRPRTKNEFWSNKLSSNVERDRRQTLELENAGWRVVRLWEHEIFETPDKAVEKVERAVSAKHWAPEQDWRVVKVDVRGLPDDETWYLQGLRSAELSRNEDRKRSAKTTQ